MKRLAIAGSLFCVLNTSVLLAQSASANPPKFDVVSIKPCQEPPQVPGAIYPPRGNSSPGNLRTDCFPLLDAVGFGLIRDAYASDPFTPINGGPSWLHSAFYEINAKAEGNPDVATMRGPMMQALLEEYFRLKIHHQTIEGPVYYLSVARGGPKLHPFTEGSCTPHTTPLAPGEKYCMSNISGLSPASAEAQGVTLDDFAILLRPVLERRPVNNKTGITGRFDIRVEFSREGISPAMTTDPKGYPSIFTAMQEQLGLRLESGKGPVETFVIDYIERPVEER